MRVATLDGAALLAPKKNSPKDFEEKKELLVRQTMSKNYGNNDK